MTTPSEWEHELAALLSELGPTRPMLMAWAPIYEAESWYRRSLVRWEVALYAPDAHDGDRPVALSFLHASTALPSEQPVLVEVAGRPEPGGALAFVLPGGTVLYGSLPAHEPGSLRRWGLHTGERPDSNWWQRVWASDPVPSERVSWPDWDNRLTIRSVIGLIAFGLGTYANGTSRGSWPLICGGLLMAMGGGLIAVIATRRSLSRRA